MNHFQTLLSNNLILRPYNRVLASGEHSTVNVEFPEPYRYDSSDVYTWAQSPPALMTFRAGRKPELVLGTKNNFAEDDEFGANNGTGAEEEVYAPAVSSASKVGLGGE